MPQLQKVFLVGPLGAGKSTIGNYLAQKVQLQFADTDTEIESFFNNVSKTRHYGS